LKVWTNFSLLSDVPSLVSFFAYEFLLILWCFLFAVLCGKMDPGPSRFPHGLGPPNTHDFFLFFTSVMKYAVLLFRDLFQYLHLFPFLVVRFWHSRLEGPSFFLSLTFQTICRYVSLCPPLWRRPAEFIGIPPFFPRAPSHVQLSVRYGQDRSPPVFSLRNLFSCQTP